MADLFLGRPRSRRYPKFNIRRDIPCDAEVQLQGLPAEGCKKDPNPNGCGHGEVSEVRREQVQIFQICLDAYANLTCGG